jgi:hypothetical protein
LLDVTEEEAWTQELTKQENFVIKSKPGKGTLAKCISAAIFARTYGFRW